MPGSEHPCWIQGGLPGAASEWLQSFKGRFEAAFPVGVEQGLGVPRGLGISLEDRRLLSKPTHPGKAQLFALRQAKGFLCGTETISGLIFVSPASQQSAIDLGR